MSDERQVEANRQNAQHSTGPRTPEGKARSALNSRKHGLTGKQIVLPGEDAGEFDEFRTRLLAELDPRGELEEAIAEKMVTDLWRLRRPPMLEALVYRRQQLELTQRALRGKKIVESLAHVDIPPESQQAYDDARTELDEPPVSLARALETQRETFRNLGRYEAALGRSFFRSLHELQRLQLARSGGAVAAPAVVDVNISP